MTNTVSSSWGSLLGNVKSLLGMDLSWGLFDMGKWGFGYAYYCWDWWIMGFYGLYEEVGLGVGLYFDNCFRIQCILDWFNTDNIDRIGNILTMKILNPIQIFDLLFLLYLNSVILHLNCCSNNRFLWVIDKISLMCFYIIVYSDLFCLLFLGYCYCIGI